MLPTLIAITFFTTVGGCSQALDEAIETRPAGATVHRFHADMNMVLINLNEATVILKCEDNIYTAYLLETL